jgi:hypothetical protein
MSILHKKILTLGFGCFISALAHSTTQNTSSASVDYFKTSADQAPDPSGNSAAYLHDSVAYHHLSADYLLAFGNQAPHPSGAFVLPALRPVIEAKRYNWTPEKNARLQYLVARCGSGNWDTIAFYMPDQNGQRLNGQQCRDQWLKHFAPGTKRNPWNAEEDKLLRQLVDQCGHKWNEISKQINNRSPQDCGNRYRDYHQITNLNRGPWTQEETSRLVGFVFQYGAKNWNTIASFMPGRTGKQCRNKWMNCPTLSLKRGSWTPEEDNRLEAAVTQYGTDWIMVAQQVQTRNLIQCRKRHYRLQAQQLAPTQPLSAPPQAQFSDNPADYFKLSADQGYPSGASALPPTQQPDSISLRTQFAHLPEDDQNSAQPSAKQSVSFPPSISSPLN